MMRIVFVIIRVFGIIVYRFIYQNYSIEILSLIVVVLSLVSVFRVFSISLFILSFVISNYFQYYVNEDSKMGLIVIVVVIGIIVFIVVIVFLCMSGYLIWRNWKWKNIKSMNFDNLVYRKIIEEEDEDEFYIGRIVQIGYVYFV